ncbi:hypothetical protein [Paenibacillus ehimensis]|uniref:hypothetical protein n=1 Tax=Paenibacillus ehimensis TaxID=79264 RepID=UPI000FDBBFD3|nr:hypothetical protein [Paenibacillus ehimensis]
MKNFFKHPIIVGSITSFITLGIITPIVAYLKSVSILNSLFLIWEFILSIFNFKISLWIIIVSIILFVIVRKLIKNADIEKDFNPFSTYKEDIIDGIKWEWKWIPSSSGYTLPKNSPVPTCNNCKGFLVSEHERYYPYGNLLVCEHCSFEKKITIDLKDYREKIRREIFRRVRSGEWKSSVDARNQ